jgi:CPA2 family monovalent cation:H+ antiporter-2
LEFEGGIFADIVAVFLAAFVGGLAARLLRLPVILGYLAVGMAVGPHALGLVENAGTVRTLAEFGVVLLLFAVGVEVSFRDLRKLGRVVIAGALAQVVLTSGIAFLILLAFGRVPREAVVLGLVISLSSTMVVLKTLSDRGELHSLHGRILTGILLLQDLAFVPMIALLPALGAEGASTVLADLGLGLLKAGVVLTLAVVLGTRVVPVLMSRISSLGSREVFLLTVMAVVFASATLTRSVGLSAALGAFVAGLVLSESDFGHRALAEVVPLRDAFASFFFVSLGMLTDPGFLVDHIFEVLLVMALVVFLKSAVSAALTRSFGYMPHTAVLTGAGLAQVGEFSFILAAAATAQGIVDSDLMTLTVVSAVLTMALTPSILAATSKALDAASQRFQPLRPYYRPDIEYEGRLPALNDHVIVCGLGRVGSLVAQALADHNVPFICIDPDPYVVARWRQAGRHALQGASQNATILEACRVKQARMMVLSTADPVSTQVTAQAALEANPKLDIVARVRWRNEGERLQRLGVTEVVWPEMEAGLEILRHSLHRYHTGRVEVDLLVSSLRDHLSFGEAASEDVLPPEEGLGEELAPPHHSPDDTAGK